MTVPNVAGAAAGTGATQEDAGAPTPPNPGAGTDNQDPAPKGDDDLGEKGKAALAAERAARRDAERRAKDGDAAIARLRPWPERGRRGIPTRGPGPLPRPPMPRPVRRTDPPHWRLAPADMRWPPPTWPTTNSAPRSTRCAPSRRREPPRSRSRSSGSGSARRCRHPSPTSWKRTCDAGPRSSAAPSTDRRRESAQTTPTKGPKALWGCSQDRPEGTFSAR